MKKRSKASIHKRDGGKCKKCGSTENLTMDHIIPEALGGTSSTSNLQLLCETCNAKKADSLDPEQNYSGRQIMCMANTIKRLKKENAYLKRRIVEIARRIPVASHSEHRS